MDKKNKEKKVKKDKNKESKKKRNEEQTNDANKKKVKLIKEDKESRKDKRKKKESNSTLQLRTSTKELGIKSKVNNRIEETAALSGEHKIETQRSINKLVDIQTELNEIKTEFNDQIQYLSQIIETDINNKLKTITSTNPTFNLTTNSNPNIIQKNKELEDKVNKLQQQLNMLKNNNNSLSCDICMNCYHVPHALQCGHTFCFICIKKWLNKQQNENNPFTCPSCRFKIKVKPSFVRPLHFHILNSLAPEQTDIKKEIEKQFLLYNKDKQAWKGIFLEPEFLDTHISLNQQRPSWRQTVPIGSPTFRWNFVPQIINNNSISEEESSESSDSNFNDSINNNVSNHISDRSDSSVSSYNDDFSYTCSINDYSDSNSSD